MRSNTIVSVACRKELINEHEMFCECTALQVQILYVVRAQMACKEIFSQKKAKHTYLCTCVMKSYESCVWVTKILPHSTEIICVCEQVFSHTARLGWLQLLKYCC